MKTSDGSFHRCYNGQAVVDADHQVIIATDVSDCAADVGHLSPMVQRATTNTGSAPGQVLADAGYTSGDHLAQAAEFAEQTGTEFFIAPGRTKHEDPTPVSPRGRIPNDATPKQRMARKLKTKKGHRVYARRKVIVEPVFGQMGTLQNGQHLLLRGLDQARSEWSLLAACHNLRKLHRHLGIDGWPAWPPADNRGSRALLTSRKATSNARNASITGQLGPGPRRHVNNPEPTNRTLHDPKTRLLTRAPSRGDSPATNRPLRPERAKIGHQLWIS
ncbi:transposase [Leekyejoonella antrihumi]|uniref:transposase n=1 Tax=Leekyejoonella antrihumi TaxID=1660198 RepID=UPI003CCC647B